MKKVVPVIIEFKPYVPKPHPMQHRIDEFMAIPSLYKSKEQDK